MSSVPKNIKELYDLLKNSISNAAEIADVQMTRLTAPGENYGSVMMRMDIRLKNKENGKEEMLYGVTKLIPPNPDIQKIFNTQVTFKNEIAFYATVVPTLVEFQKEEGMEGIKCFANLLGSRINLDGSDVVNEDAVLMLENLKIIDVQMTRLTAPGENFGSVMMRVDISLRNKGNRKEEIMYGVAKLIPPNPDIQKMFNTQVTFKNEIAFYATVAPILVEFQKDEGIEGIKCFAKLLGSRINLDGSDVVNEDAVLMLENLKMIGYSTAEPQKGYDFEMAKLILRDLAEFHGVSLGLKMRKPAVFNEKIRPYLHKFEPPTNELLVFLQMIRTILSENEECIPLIPKITAWGTKNSDRKPREPFATMFHQDLRVNNMMQKYEDGKPVANKFVDFQVIDYGSPAADVFFFLFTNVPLPILKNHLDHLLLYYHECLIQILKELHCPTAPFSFESFLEEIRIEAEYEFPHALMFSTFVVFMGKRPPEEYDDLEPDPEKMLPLIDAANRERAQYITLECERRGWLY